MGNRLVICAHDIAAYGFGIRKGQTLADAQSLHPPLLTREHDSALSIESFAALADWHGALSPIVAIETSAGPFGDMVIDITGASHLFGGERAMLDHSLARLAGLSIKARAAIAPTVGAAWALARFSPGAIVAPGRCGEALARLPLYALRLDAETVAGLEAVGLKRVGQLYGRNRGALAARFGREALLRLDKALGDVEERLVPRLPPLERQAERRFAEPLSQLEDIVGVTRGLAGALCACLEKAGEGAQGFHLFLFRVDHKVMTLCVNAARATRDPAHIGRLFANRIETIREDFDAGFGIEAMRLGAGSLSPLGSFQHSALERVDGLADLESLCDRLTSRLGPQAVLRAVEENAFIPERAVRLAPAIAAPPALPDLKPVGSERPLRLLPRPERIEVIAEVPEGPPVSMVWRKKSYRFPRAAGPERIGVEWWRPGEGRLTRDYYKAEDGEGHRFWLFREGLYSQTDAPRWFMHGIFP